MDLPQGSQRIHAGCWVDWDQQGIWRDQQFVPLPWRTFRLLACLVQHANQVVPQTLLFTVGWNQTRSRWDLQAHIHRIRLAIEPDPHHPQWLVTRHGSGYLLHLESWSQPA